ncbi:carbon-nitrogen hydrolase family protein [Testudinibacter sp. TR-2022]|uniref:carbon-nitrogen hydrolase family protein n=1 Tax=Testudinibacter sp. TR-2022 TaxID=2585029 RepID=UPI001119FF56|nr:carbon-nitrogen hydrolase family protein [Testudinibacter sp. TR-2022]TNH09249.1 carbon-nitrogen hydrolase family protein [Pasteurellaceae bacterium Phil11]TNH25762.1 carbon-nitrogen hydrolase family protein [Testudinibacter sp. TR-2022]TNH28565.1 carbon-nitrogen hydrolase family protein [Testudinibacter sp. TR-2022]
MTAANFKVATIQMVSTTDINNNIDTMQTLVRKAAKAGAKWVVLPEYWALMGAHEQDKLAIAEAFGEGRLQTLLSELAKALNIVLFSGSIALRSSEDNKVLNSMLVYGEQGELLSRYDKIHLFSYTGIGEKYCEADSIQAGYQVPQLKIGDIQVGQGICYDLRFPELFRAQTPYDVLVLPAAFTYTTGKAHWEVLLRARAIENQCYVIASAQGGRHQNGRTTFGQSMIIDPWGEIISGVGEGEGFALATLDFRRLAEVRSQLPALDHRQLFIRS